VPDHSIDSPFPRVPRLLVVDDESQVREFLKDRLTEDGFDVQTASDGREALGVLTRERFDLVLTDLKMPGMDGWDLSEHMLVRYPHLPIVMLTGYGTAIEHQAQCRGIALLHKPVDAVDLTRTIRNALAHAVG
jgi:DNA-binding NtrC family response regulator